MTQSARTQPRAVASSPSFWLATFALATVLGFGVALQVWLSVDSARRPSFWQPAFLQPQLIRWYTWALLVPLVFLMLQRLRADVVPWWRAAAIYAGVGVLSIFVHAVTTAFALGWWWAFPSLIPMDPEWHIVDELRSRTVLGALVFALIAVVFHFLRQTPVGRPLAIDAAPQTTQPVSGTIPLRTRDRVVFVATDNIDWIEADRDHVLVHVGGVTHRVRESLATFESRLSAGRFLRVSRSAIVNVAAINEVQPWFRGDFMIILRDASRVPTGRKYRDRITRLF